MEKDEQTPNKIFVETMEVIEELENKVDKLLDGRSDLIEDIKLIGHNVGELYGLYGDLKITVSETIKIVDETKNQKNNLITRFNEFCEDQDKYHKSKKYKKLNAIFNKINEGFQLTNTDFQTLDQYKKTTEEDAVIWLLLGKIYNGLFGNPKEIYEYLDRATQLDDSLLCAWCGKLAFISPTNKDLPIILEHFKEVDSTECKAFYAFGLVKVGKIGDGFKIINEIIEHNNNSIYYNIRASMYAFIKSDEKAIEDYNNAISLKKEPSYYLNLAMIYFKQGNIDEIINTLEKCIDIDKSNYKANRMLADIYRYNKKNPLKALIPINRALENNMSGVHDLCFKADLFYELDRKESALELYEKAISSCEIKNCNTRSNYYDLILKTIVLSEIKGYVFAYLSDYNNDIHIGISWIEALINNGHIEIAEHIYSMLNPEELSSDHDYNSYAWISYKLEKTDVGLEYIEKTISKKPKPEFIDTYASLLSQKGEDEMALEYFKKAVETTVYKNNINIDEMERLFKRNNKSEEFYDLISKLF